MEKINVLIDEESLNKRVKEIAEQISSDYGNEELILVCILKGAVYFATDLSKKIKNNEVIMDFMKVSSYGIGQRETTGKIDFKLDLSVDIENKNVIVVEDIVDSGKTMRYLCDYLKNKNPKSLKICTLLDKPARRTESIKADYVGFTIDDKFVLGYGLDYDEKYRNLPYIGYID